MLFGVRKLVVETDAKYIKGMLQNPDMMPTATINRWIDEISMFQFTLDIKPEQHLDLTVYHIGRDKKEIRTTNLVVMMKKRKVERSLLKWQIQRNHNLWI